jgi:hypothetical protein
MLKNPYVKNVLSALAVAVFGYVLLGLTFLFDFVVQSIIRIPLRLFLPADFEMTIGWVPPLLHISFMVIIILISWLVFRSKLPVLGKAIYMTVPTAVVLATLGIFLYRWPLVVYSLSSLLVAGVLYYFYRTKQSWLYYYAVLLVAAVLLIMTLLGVEI